MRMHPLSKRLDDGEAFLPDEPFVEDDGFAEEYLVSATTGESMNLDVRDEVVPEEEGGPFLIGTAEELEEDL